MVDIKRQPFGHPHELGRLFPRLQSIPAEMAALVQQIQGAKHDPGYSHLPVLYDGYSYTG